MAQVECFKDEAGEWRWRRRADNGEIIATSGEGYSRKESARNMAATQFPDDLLIEVVPEEE